jgi:hypothetical protein
MTSIGITLPYVFHCLIIAAQCWHSRKCAFRHNPNSMATIEAGRLRGEMHDKALAFRAWTSERSSP